MISITRFTKERGILTKRLSLSATGELVSDSSRCAMAHGKAERLSIDRLADLPALIESLTSIQALALGTLRPGLPDMVGITPQDKLNGAAVNVVARTADAITYIADRPALVLLDHDTKGMPPEVRERMAGGFWSALVQVLPELAGVGHVTRSSTSAGLHRSDTDEPVKGSDGLHIYIAALNGRDIPRFLTTLHDRCWLNGLGWMMVGAAGQLLERSIVDRMVGASERLVFEGRPPVEPPLVQDQQSRRPVFVDGEMLDTVAACRPLTVVEQQRLGQLRAAARQSLAPEARRVKEQYVAANAERLARDRGISLDAARRIFEQQANGTLLADVALVMDDEELGRVTVADVLDDPAKFEGLTLNDPVEGYDHRINAMILRRSDGEPYLRSFSHGRTIYCLRYDASAVRARVEGSPDPVGAFIRCALTAELSAVETKLLTNEVARRSGVGVKVVEASLKAARQEQRERRAEEAHQRRLAERTDPRPQLPAPPSDAPWMPEMDAINEVLSRSSAALPPMRDIDDAVTQARKRLVPSMHAFKSANHEED